MPRTLLHVIAKVQAKPERVDAVRMILSGIVEPTRREPGCISYRLLHNPADPTEFATIEEWGSTEAEQAHFFTPHVLEALHKITDQLAAPPDIRRYRSVL